MHIFLKLLPEFYDFPLLLNFNLQTWTWDIKEYVFDRILSFLTLVTHSVQDGVCFQHHNSSLYTLHLCKSLFPHTLLEMQIHDSAIC